METHSGAGPVPARRPPGGVEPGHLADQGPGEGPPVHLTASRQPVAVLESLLIAPQYDAAADRAHPLGPRCVRCSMIQRVQRPVPTARTR